MTRQTDGGRAYLPSSWLRRRLISRAPWLERLLARLASRVIGDPVLEVAGRRSGRTHSTLARPITVDGRRYLVAIRGETHWARNLRAAGRAVLRERGVSTTVTATEVTGAEREAVVRSFLASSPYAPTRRILTEVLPDPAQHPVFLVTPVAESEGPAAGPVVARP